MGRGWGGGTRSPRGPREGKGAAGGASGGAGSVPGGARWGPEQDPTVPGLRRLAAMLGFAAAEWKGSGQLAGGGLEKLFGGSAGKAREGC